MSKIIIDAGHWAGDPGAVIGGIKERDVCMKIRDEVMKLIPDAIMVPDEYDLRHTIDWINSFCNPDDIAIAIHLNSNNNTNINGTECYYYNEPKIAEILSKHVSKSLSGVNRGARLDSESFVGSLGFLRQIRCNTALLEILYISHSQERAKLAFPSTLTKVAEGIRNGIIEWRGPIETYKAQLSYLLKLLEELLRKYYGKV